MINTDKTAPATNGKKKGVVGDDDVAWYAMRDTKRPNALKPAYKMLTEKGFEVFTPMVQRVVKRHGRNEREEVPAIRDLLFVHDTRRNIDPIEAITPTLRYRFVKGGRYREATIVRDADMERFIAAVKSTPSPKYFQMGEITHDMIGRKVHVYGGPLNGLVAPLRKLRGAKKKRIFVELPNFLTVEVELTEFDYLQVVE